MDQVPALAMMLASFAAADMEPDGPMCRANGQWYRQGEIACIEPPCMAPRLSLCGMVLNNSAWLKIEDGCPTSIAPPDGSLQTATAAPQSVPVDSCGR